MRRVLLAVVDSTQNLYSRLANTGQAWSLKSDYLLNVSNGVSDYLLAVDDSYGKPIQVLTYWPANPSLPQRYVEFYEFADMNFDWGWPVNVASFMYTDGSPNTAMRMAFYNKDDGSRWVRVLPQPQISGGTYLITFASGDWAATAGIQDSPVLSQFHSLVETWASQSILPSCQWVEDQKYNMDHRKELLFALKNDEARFAEEFDGYCRNLIQDHMGTRASSMDSDALGTGGWY
jgi:hypothetical protein